MGCKLCNIGSRAGACAAGVELMSAGSSLYLIES